MGDVIRMPTTDNTRGWNTEDGFIMLARGLYKNSKTWQNLNPVQKVVMVTLLMMANHKDNKWWDGNKFITVKRGQLVTSLNNLVSACGKGVSIKNVRTAIEKLEKMGFLANQSTKQYRLITIVNYDVYQSPDNYLANQSAKHRQSTGKAVATNKNGNNVNNKYTCASDQNQGESEAAGKPSIPDSSGDKESAMGETPQEEPAREPGKVAGTKKSGKRYEYTEDFEQFWSLYPRKKEKPAAFRVWCARIKEGYTAGDLIAAAKHYARECKSLDMSERYIKHAKTFLGPDKPFLDYIHNQQENADNAPQPGTEPDWQIERLKKKREREKNAGAT